jgi:hypothetical protein
MTNRIRRHAGIPGRLLAVVAGLAAALAGCTDDVVCPDGSLNARLYVSATVVETRGVEGESASGAVFCSADTLPVFLIASVNGREFPEVVSSGTLGLTATLEDDAVAWQPGAACSLKVTTDYGVARACVVVPGSFAVSAPETIGLGEALTLSWTASPAADYYTVVATLAGGRAADTVSLLATTRDTTVTIAASDITMAGVVSGRVRAVAGPFPDGGAAGNVTGAGWGFFTVAFSDTAGAFTVTVHNTAGE